MAEPSLLRSRRTVYDGSPLPQAVSEASRLAAVMAVMKLVRMCPRGLASWRDHHDACGGKVKTPILFRDGAWAQDTSQLRQSNTGRELLIGFGLQRARAMPSLRAERLQPAGHTTRQPTLDPRDDKAWDRACTRRRRRRSPSPSSSADERCCASGGEPAVTVVYGEQPLCC